jgi:hypothetical protein
MMVLIAAATTFTVLALFLGDSALVFLSEQLERRRVFRLELERELTRRVELQQRRDAIIWRQLRDEHRQPVDEGQP